MKSLRTSVCFTVCVFLLAHAALAQQAVVERIRGEYPTPLGDTHGKFLVEVACVTGKGLLKKDWGTFVRVADGTGVAQDIVMDRDGTHYDILGDGEGAAVPRWDPVTNPPKVDPARYYAPVCNNTPPAPDPDPLPPAWVADLVATFAAAETALRAELKAIRQELADLKAAPSPNYEGRVLGFGVTLRPVK